MLLLPRLCLLVGWLWLSTGIPEWSAVDDLGRTIRLASPAKRVVSLAPSVTETLFAIGAGDQIVGVTDYCNYPPAAATKQRVGGVINPNIEAIVGLKPDLIILSMEGNARDDFNKLQTLNIPLFVTNPRTLTGIHNSIRALGLLTDHDSIAALIVEKMRATEDSVSALPVQKKSVLVVVSLQPLIVVGEKTFLSELLALAGGVNAVGTSVSTYPTLSREAVIASNPDVIIIMSEALRNVDDLLLFFPEWKSLRAVAGGHVFRIDSDLVSRPGPRSSEALLALYNIIQRGKG